MKAKDAQTLSTVRSIKAAFTNLEKESGIDGIGDEQVIPLLPYLFENLPFTGK